MRKVIVSMNITLDGFMAGPDDGLEWHFPYWNDEMARESTIQLSRADTIVLGRKTYQAMAGYWPVSMIHPGFPRHDFAFAEMMNRYLKVVFSRTLVRASWNNSVVIAQGVGKQVAMMKRQEGRHIIVYGSPSIVGCLMDSGLIDEYQAWVHPVVLGAGKPFCMDATMLELASEKKFSSGVVLFFYKAGSQSRQE